ncbi:hypothetical protein SAE02_74000 [Skermanella aerolata]|uniref:Uncharacterized protein n=1 Tax=Skermanella aerolata TaxID=393310 RepID=A0A512E3E5_9PROT|nr:hypothetical protein SAE02_74000 [Skermanella aerolata]
MADLITYIGNSSATITDCAERWDHGEIISTAFAEATVDLVISRRFAKKQQMQWSRKGAIGSCRPDPAPLTARSTTCSLPGIRPCPPMMFSQPHPLPQPSRLPWFLLLSSRGARGRWNYRAIAPETERRTNLMEKDLLCGEPSE